MTTELTVADVLKLIADRAQQCRESGDSDMRNILNTVRSIKSMIAENKPREEIIAVFTDDDDEG